MSKKSQIMEMYLKGSSYTEIKKTLGVSKGTVSYHCAGIAREVEVERRIQSRKTLNLNFKIVRASEHIGQRCKSCNAELPSSRKRVFCDLECQQKFYFRERYILWIKNQFEDTYENSRWYKKAVIHRDGYKCSSCGISSWNNKELSLELEHINGDSSNNSPSNLCLLCPNCHSQSPTYKSKNKGNGRHWRRERYRQGKSF